MLKHSKLFLAAAFLVAMIGGFFIPANVHAAGQTHPLVSPTKQRVSLEPGEHYNGQFYVYNAGTEDFSYKVYATPYSAVGDNYDLDYDTETSYTQIAKWITIEKTEGTIKPEEKQYINFSVDVPEDAPGGGQYATLMVETEDTRDQHNIGVVNRVGMVFYASVSGQTVMEGTIIENKIPTFFLKPPLSVTALVENTGNVHFDATYTLKVFPLFSGEEVYTNEEDPASKIVLPETRRFNTVSWDGAPSLGLFRVEQTVEILGEKNTVKKLVFICPLWLIIVIILLIGAIVFWLVSRNRSRDRKNKEKSE